MSSELKIFHSLNCSLCASPYSKSSNDPKYPYESVCGKAICGECCKEEQRLKKEERRHQCDFQLHCYYPYKFRSFFRDLFNDPSIIESPNGNGWLLSEPITIPLKCSKCDTQWRKMKANPLFCFKADSSPEWFWMECSICNDSYSYPKSMEMRNNWLREFLCELPELIEQIPKVKEIRIKVKTKIMPLLFFLLLMFASW
ncbi:unnamed protein product, partial [Mesorhabditis belari]|uniref:Uncharacterized protein n=1 Tax=Mesorhabditis belari TaxID=2138241 RepID=A0AAF3EHI5_9BILA